MSEPSPSRKGEHSEGHSERVSEVLDALTPLTDRMGSLDGFAVAHADRQAIGRPPDPERVEIRFYQRPPRHPSEVDHALGMLRDQGFSVEKDRRGRGGCVCIYLTVDLSDGSPTENVERSSGGEQGSLTDGFS